MRAVGITRGFCLVGWIALGQLLAVPAATAQDLSKRLENIRAEESDEVKRVPVQDTGSKIDPPADLSSAGRERAVPPPEPREDRPATLPLLSRAQRKALFAAPVYQRRFQELTTCREELAVIRKVNPAQIPAGRVQLDWMVGSDGDVQGVKVSALSPTDPDLLTCVHRKVSAWQISPAPAKPYRATHQLGL